MVISQAMLVYPVGSTRAVLYVLVNLSPYPAVVVFMPGQAAVVVAISVSVAFPPDGTSGDACVVRRRMSPARKKEPNAATTSTRFAISQAVIGSSGSALSTRASLTAAASMLWETVMEALRRAVAAK